MSEFNEKYCSCTAPNPNIHGFCYKCGFVIEGYFPPQDETERYRNQCKILTQHIAEKNKLIEEKDKRIKELETNVALLLSSNTKACYNCSGTGKIIQHHINMICPSCLGIGKIIVLPPTTNTGT